MPHLVMKFVNYLLLLLFYFLQPLRNTPKLKSHWYRSFSTQHAANVEADATSHFDHDVWDIDAIPHGSLSRPQMQASVVMTPSQSHRFTLSSPGSIVCVCVFTLANLCPTINLSPQTQLRNSRCFSAPQLMMRSGVFFL